MSAAQVTEAHEHLALRVATILRHDAFIAPAAQLIADSEARAVDTVRKERDGYLDCIEGICKECAYVEDGTLLPPVGWIAKLKAERDQLRARCDELIESQKTTDLAFQEQYARAEKAEAELAKERVRLDWVIEQILRDSRRGLARALGHRGDMEQVVLDRAAIDAALAATEDAP